MKRILCVSFAAALLLVGCAVPKKPADPAPTPMPEIVASASLPEESPAPAEDGDASCWTPLDAAAPMQVDLDGDGTPETVTVVVDEEAYVTDVTVVGKNGTLTDHLDTALAFLKAYDGDAKRGDGSRELYLTGDTASNDYSTFAYRIRNGKLEKTEIYGDAVDCDGSTLTIERSVDVLGTYSGSCQYALNDDFTFSRVSPFMVLRYDGDWAERALTLQMDGLPVETAAGETTLQKGAVLMLVETDQQSYATLEDRQGTLYRIAMEKPAEDWRWFIGGIAEEDWFGQLLYAG